MASLIAIMLINHLGLAQNEETQLMIDSENQRLLLPFSEKNSKIRNLQKSVKLLNRRIIDIDKELRALSKKISGLTLQVNKLEDKQIQNLSESKKIEKTLSSQLRMILIYTKSRQQTIYPSAMFFQNFLRNDYLLRDIYNESINNINQLSFLVQKYKEDQTKIKKVSTGLKKHKRNKQKLQSKLYWEQKQRLIFLELLKQENSS